MTDVPPDETLPCGCRLTFRVDKGQKVMQIAPCRQTCTNFHATLEMARDVGKPVQYREGP
jgi:hypothetical protein